MADGHTIRDRVFDRTPAAIQDTGETYECVIVGRGISGLSAAIFYQRETSVKKSCLVLENHPIFGGEAKRNEFNMDGQLSRRKLSPGSRLHRPADLHRWRGCEPRPEWSPSRRPRDM